MSWEQIESLLEMGFEIASHTRTHTHVDQVSREEFEGELEYIEMKCRQLDIARPKSFAYPAYVHTPVAARHP